MTCAEVKRQPKRSCTTLKMQRNWLCTDWTCTQPKTLRVLTSCLEFAPLGSLSTETGTWLVNCQVWRAEFFMLFLNVFFFNYGHDVCGWTNDVYSIVLDLESTDLPGPRFWRFLTSGTTSTSRFDRGSLSNANPQLASSWQTTEQQRSCGKSVSRTTPFSGKAT